MANWKQFEIDCTDYLNKTYGDLACFTLQGGSDSTIPDIYVKTNKGDSFYIEVKHSPAQSGQFVLLPDIEISKFIYSKQNSTTINSYAETIMTYMNADFDSFRAPGTKGRKINMDKSIFASWIIGHYSDMGVEFIISNDYVIIPIQELSNYSIITTNFREKRSGSSPVGKSRIGMLCDYITHCGYPVDNYRSDNDKLFISSSSDLNKVRFIISDTEYMFSKRNNEYEIRKLSDTHNANVIFSITLKVSPEQASLLREQFERRLK